MEPNLKSAYDNAIKYADEMLSGMNIIANATLRQRLTQSVSAVREQISVAEKVSARIVAKAEYESEMSKRLAGLEQAINLVTMAAKKTVLVERFTQMQNSINQLNAMIGNLQRAQQQFHSRARRNFR